MSAAWSRTDPRSSSTADRSIDGDAVSAVVDRTDCPRAAARAAPSNPPTVRIARSLARLAAAPRWPSIRPSGTFSTETVRPCVATPTRYRRSSVSRVVVVRLPSRQLRVVVRVTVTSNRPASIVVHPAAVGPLDPTRRADVVTSVSVETSTQPRPGERLPQRDRSLKSLVVSTRVSTV